MGCATSAETPLSTSRLPLDRPSGELASVEPCRFVVEIEKTEGMALGLVLFGVVGDVDLLVCSVANWGCAIIWNTKHPSLQLRPGDKIVSVNGIGGENWKMVDEFSKDGILKCQVVRSGKRSIAQAVAFKERCCELRRFRQQVSVADRDSVCAICMEENANPEHHTVELPCKHVFHSSCIVQWFGRGQIRCPLCNYRPEITKRKHLN